MLEIQPIIWEILPGLIVSVLIYFLIGVILKIPSESKIQLLISIFKKIKKVSHYVSMRGGITSSPWRVSSNERLSYDEIAIDLDFIINLKLSKKLSRILSDIKNNLNMIQAASLTAVDIAVDTDGPRNLTEFQDFELKKIDIQQENNLQLNKNLQLLAEIISKIERKKIRFYFFFRT